MDSNRSNDSAPFARILIVGGFCEPLWLLHPLRRALTPCARSVEIWRDRIVFRNLDTSIQRLREQLVQPPIGDGGVAIVTHSFGDWIVRQAIAGCSEPPVGALVSVAPIIGLSPIGRLLWCVAGKCVSEVPVMADAELSSANARLDGSIRRLVLWGEIDALVRPVALVHEENLVIEHYWATHLSIVLQPNVQRRIRQFLCCDPSSRGAAVVRAACINNSRGISSGFTGLTK